MQKFLLGAAAVVGSALIATAPAQAAGGCGRGMFRTPNQDCVPDSERGRFMGPGANAWVDGRFYPGHGWWSQGRWYQHREAGNHGRTHRYY
jgi:hypothetical protein